jgi:hypothetical protein
MSDSSTFVLFDAFHGTGALNQARYATACRAILFQPQMPPGAIQERRKKLLFPGRLLTVMAD